MRGKITRFWCIGTGIPIGRRNFSHQRLSTTFPGAVQIVIRAAGRVAASRGCVEGGESKNDVQHFAGRSDDRTGDLSVRESGSSWVRRGGGCVVCQSRDGIAGG